MAADGSSLEPAMFLYAPDGALETKLVGDYNVGRIRLEEYQLKQTGTYTIVAAASGRWATTGKYGLSLVLIGGAPSAGTPALPVTPTPVSATAPPPAPTAPPPSAPPPPTSGNILTDSVPLPSQVSTDPVVIGTNALLASVLVAIFYFAATLFNGTLKENYETVQRWARPFTTVFGILKPQTELQSQSARRRWPLLNMVFIVLVTAAINSAVDPGFGLSQRGLIVFAAMVVTVIVSTYSYEGIQILITEYGFHIPAAIKAYPLSILLAIVFVAVSRLIEFQPGFIFGFVGAFTVLSSTVVPDKGQRAVTILSGVSFALVFALSAFVLREPLASTAGSLWRSILDTVLVALFVGGLESLLFGLVPLTFLDGGTLASWKKVLWFVVFLLILFLFVHIVVNKTDALPSAVRNMTNVTIVGLALAGLAFSVVFWAYFRIRTRART